MDSRNDINEQIKYYVDIGNYGEALILLRRLLEEDPNNPDILCRIATCLVQINETDEARDFVEQAAKIDPDNTKVKLLSQQLNMSSSQSEPDETEPPPPPTHQGFDLDTSDITYVARKICPNCKAKIDKSSWRCGFCGQMFQNVIIKKGLIYIAIILLVFFGLGTLIHWFYTAGQNPARVENLAGGAGDNVIIKDIEWKCYASMLSMRCPAEAAGTIINTASKPINKLNVTVHLFGEEHESAFIWFDIYNLPPNEPIHFAFPRISSSFYARNCELRIQDVTFHEQDTLSDDQSIDIYVPNSGTFHGHVFTDAQGEVIHRDRRFNYEAPQTVQESSKFVVFLKFIKNFLISIAAIWISVLLLNYCDPEKEWNEEWKLEGVASLCFVISIMLLRALETVIGGLLFMGLILQILKLVMFYIFFRRNLLYTIVLIIFYFSLVTSINSFLSWISGLISGTIGF